MKFPGLKDTFTEKQQPNQFYTFPMCHDITLKIWHIHQPVWKSVNLSVVMITAKKKMYKGKFNFLFLEIKS